MISIQDPQLTIPSVCRGTKFYVNPSSSSILELGTRDHPYQTMKGVMSEVLNYHSNLDRNLTIYLKGGEYLYLEDETNYLLNITSVTITTYSDDGDSSERATLIPTQVPQDSENKKAAFSILANTELRLTQVILEGGYTDSELKSLGLGKFTIFVLRSNIFIDNINFKRGFEDFGKEIAVLYLGYLQQKV